jgi:hypothetical protein
LSNSMKRFLRSFLVCLVVGYFPLIFLWKSNLDQVSPSTVTQNLLFTLVYVLVVYGFWFLLCRSPEKTAILSCVTAIFVFSFGHLFNAIGNRVILGLSIGYAKLFLVWFLIFVAVCIWILRARRVPDPFPVFYIVGLLVVFNLVSIITFSVQANKPNSQPAAASGVIKSNTEKLPDIYYIVLDAYARADILKSVVGYDNSAFINALKERGFYLPECAFSNYNGTELTISSVLNMDTLENLGVPVSSQTQHEAQYTNLIHHNQISKTLRSYGYQFITGRGYAAFNDINTSDVYLNYAEDQGITDDVAEKRFTGLYFNTTIFRVISELYKNSPERFSMLPVWLVSDPENDQSLNVANFWYHQNNYMFDSLEKIPDRPGNYFVYAHINAPHGPYVYRSDGSFRFPLNDQPEAVEYVDMVKYVNQRMLAVIDALVKNSETPPIIIIQADHGIHKLTAGLDKHKILSAYYLPGILSDPPYKTMTPVNNFRLILKNYFDPSVQLIPDTMQVRFTNQFEQVNSSCDLKPK